MMGTTRAVWFAVAALDGAHCFGQEARYSISELGDCASSGVIGWSLNDAGEAAGEFGGPNGAAQAVIVSPAGVRSLFGESRRVQESIAYGVNGRGHVVGALRIQGTPGQRAFLRENGSFVDVHSRLTLGGSSLARSINDAGDIAGAAEFPPASGVLHATRYRGGALTDIHAAWSLGSFGSSANGVNAAGDLAGAYWVTARCSHAFVVVNGAFFDIHSQLAPGACSEALGINDRGQVVGSAEDASGTRRAFLYEAGTASDLNRLIAPGSGWTLEAATSVNNAGLILGIGVREGSRRAFLLRPQRSQPDTEVAVGELLDSGERFVGRAVRVRGIVRFQVLQSAAPCPSAQPDCNPVLGINVYLQDNAAPLRQLLVYRAGAPYPCRVDSQGNAQCPGLREGSQTLTGVYRKRREPEFTVGPPSQTIRWRDVFYLDAGN